jgi:SAM-dependent methyltransferase
MNKHGIDPLVWNPDLYKTKHSMIFEHGRELLGLLAAQPGERILDLGCGTGQLTEAIARTGAMATGLDSSPTMIEAARRDYPSLSFVLADATNFSFSEPFDAVFSNAAIHWMKPPEKTIECISRSLRPGGRFVTEFGGKGNIAQVLRVVDVTWREMTGRDAGWNFYFPSIAEFSSLLESYGLEVREAQLFDLPTRLEDGEKGLRNWFYMFGGELLRAIPEAARDKWFRRAEEVARPALFHDGSWLVDRRRLCIFAVKT